MTALILAICSDLFAADWQGGAWQPGLRGWPNHATATSDGVSLRMDAAPIDAYPRESDMVTTFPRPLTLAEKPEIIAHVWIPESLPTGNTASGLPLYFGIRVTITDQYPRLVWPGLFIGTKNGQPWLYQRVLLDAPIMPLSSGWWTIGIKWREDGLTQFTAAQGRVKNPPIVAQDPYEYPTYMSTVTGHFIAIRMPLDAPDNQLTPDFRISLLETKAATPEPVLTPSAAGITLSAGYPSEPYAIEHSQTLESWQPWATLKPGETAQANQGFYRAVK